jgi:hypothetical protein
MAFSKVGGDCGLGHIQLNLYCLKALIRQDYIAVLIAGLVRIHLSTREKPAGERRDS